MARTLVAVYPPAAGAIAAVALIDEDDPATPLTLDVDDLELTVTVDGHAGTVVPAGDDLTAHLYPPATADGIVAWTATAAAPSIDLEEVTARGFGVVQTNPYGATVAGVKALASDHVLTYTSHPSTGDVANWVDEVSGMVAARIGPLTGLPGDVTTHLAAQAAAVVHLGAGAYTVDAAHPERTTKQGDRAYGAVLWARYKAALDELAIAVADARTGADVPPATGRHKAAASFPAPAWHRDTGL